MKTRPLSWMQRALPFACALCLGHNTVFFFQPAGAGVPFMDGCGDLREGDSGEGDGEGEEVRENG